MTQRIVVDPITRIEGHLRIEAETEADGTIKAAYSSGTMVRGIEIIVATSAVRTTDIHTAEGRIS